MRYCLSPVHGTSGVQDPHAHIPAQKGHAAAFGDLVGTVLAQRPVAAAETAQ